jgi:arylformamidase
MWRSLVLVSAFFPISFASCLSQGTASQEGLSDALEERFDLLDANGDSVLTMEELGRPRLFKRSDSDGDGVVTRAEAAALFKSRRALRRGAASSGQESAVNEVGPDIAQDLNIPYASLPDVDPKLLSLDIYKPKSLANSAQQTARPVIVMIHGGGWRTGDKGNESQGRQKASFFVERGYIYVSINYRLSPAVQHPAHVEDVAKALAWVSDHIANYVGDPKRIFLMGHSAGAHLAALVSTDESYLQKLGKSPSMLRGVILLDSAAYDIPRRVNEMSEGRKTEELFARAFGTNVNVWRQASPISHIAPGKGIPPALVFYVDRETSKAASIEFVDALQRAGIAAASVHAKGKNHNSINRQIGIEGDGPSRLIIEFLNGKDPKTFPKAI